MAESENAIKWFSENKTIVNSDKFKPLLFKEVIKHANLNSF